MVRIHLATLSFWVFCALGASPATADAEDVRMEFERLAAELPYLTLTGVLYDRPDDVYNSRRFAEPAIRLVHNRTLAMVTSGTHPRDALIELLSHRDPKVRTLAAVALFDREDPLVLPLFVKLCADQAATFDGRPELAVEPKNGPFWGSAPPPLKQSVADIASRMVEFYMMRAGFHYGLSHHAKPGFAEYWSERKNRSHCASWFAVQLARAGQGTSPPPTESVERIRAVRRRIDALPSVDRAWVLLWLNGEAGSSALVSQRELLEACKQVGPGALLLLLQNKIPSGDPDLQPQRSSNWPYRRMTLFVLQHAAELLRAEDSEALLECERWQREYQKHGISDPTITAWWADAAARLQPDRAAEILHAGFERFQGKFHSEERAILSVAMWQLIGKAEMQFVLDWFYTENPDHPGYSFSRGKLIASMENAPNGRAMIATLIRDPRCDEIDWQSLESIVQLVNRWNDAPVVTEEELDKAWHPLGIGSYDKGKAGADEKYPRETAELKRHFSEWVRRLRQSIAEWQSD